MVSKSFDILDLIEKTKLKKNISLFQSLYKSNTDNINETSFTTLFDTFGKKNEDPKNKFNILRKVKNSYKTSDLKVSNNDTSRSQNESSNSNRKTLTDRVPTLSNLEKAFTERDLELNETNLEKKKKKNSSTRELGKLKNDLDFNPDKKKRYFHI
jgi:hypothetical protein